MVIYIFIYFLLFVIALLATMRVKNRDLLSILSLIIIVCFQGLRWKTGTDWTPYYDCFMVSDKYQVNYVEWGYYIINRCVRFFTDSYSVFLLIECAIISVCQWAFARQFFVKNVPAVLLYFFSGAIFPVRFTLAVSIFLLGYKFIFERKFLQFLIIYIIACSIHQILALTLPLYFIAHRTYNAKVLVCIYVICCCIGIMTDIVFKNLTNAVSLFLIYLPSFSQDKVLYYMQNSESTNSILSTLISYINGGLFIGLFLYLRRRCDDISRYNVLLNMYVFGLSISRIVLTTIPYLARINLCCSGGFILMLLLGIQNYKLKNRLICISLIFIYTFLAYSKQIELYPDLFKPYYSVLSSSNRLHVY